MKAERLLAHYGRIADAPDAVPRIRRFVLDLAVRGKLVQQNPNDEPASELLKRIAKEKARLVKTGEIKHEKPAESGSVGGRGIDLPAGWSVACLSETAACLDYRRVPINGTERDARIEGKPQESLFPYYGATQQQGWIDEYLFDGEFVLLGEDGVPFHDPLRTKAYLISGKSWVNNHAHVFQSILTSPRFLVHCLNVFDYAGRVVGATRAKLNQAQAVTIPISLPPLAEQHRIVAKVDELMALCDQLDKARAEREATRDRLAAASLARLNDPDTETFQDDARFALGALPAIAARPDQVKQLRQTILNLAVRGKLVPQDPKDEPASELLKRIAKERMVRVGREELRKAKGIAPPSPSAQLFQLPGKWDWTVADQLWDFENGDRSSNYPSRDQLVATGIPFVNAGHLVGGRVSLSDMNYITPAKFASLGGGKLRKGDQLYCLRGSLGKHAIFDLDYDAAIASSLVILRPVLVDCVPYLSVYLDCDIAQTLLRRFDNGSAQPNLSSANLRKYEIPLPPLAEQRRIVAKVDALMALCDKLEANLTAAADTRRRLLDALLAEALAPANARELEAAA